MYFMAVETENVIYSYFKVSAFTVVKTDAKF